ncbi:hypothetical protein NA2_19878 [Nitratireductor pacificus pht-3B]|uniref:Uncharacterized protein n=1 Tax=Nitratireductor pacificus pht-3B TaxID=391937 RepID=K2LH14_9HYPH|nr:hypothetical protein NA2_19878 [Nitratireductor pacificus pht-3B]
MKFAGGVLHWTEGEFWQSGFAYFRAAWEGWAISSGAKKVKTAPPTREAYEAAKMALAARDSKRLSKGRDVG